MWYVCIIAIHRSTCMDLQAIRLRWYRAGAQSEASAMCLRHFPLHLILHISIQEPLWIINRKMLQKFWVFPEYQPELNNTSNAETRHYRDPRKCWLILRSLSQCFKRFVFLYDSRLLLYIFWRKNVLQQCFLSLPLKHDKNKRYRNGLIVRFWQKINPI